MDLDTQRTKHIISGKRDENPDDGTHTHTTHTHTRTQTKKKNKVSSNEQENGQKTNIKHKHSVIQKDLKAYEMKFN